MKEKERINSLSKFLEKTPAPTLSAILMIVSLEKEIKELKVKNEKLKEDNKLLSWSY